MIHRFQTLFCITLVCSISSLAPAANHYVRAGAAGSGSSWADSLSALPSELIRGDTYYIADGSYGSYQCDDPVSGSMVITVKKATINDHGTDTGWDDSYGDGQATFNRPLNFKTPDWIWDGMKGDGRDPDDYGFRVIESADPAGLSNQRMVGMPPVGSMVPVSNIRLSHTAIVCLGSAYDINQNCIYSHPDTASNLTLSHNYISNGVANLITRKWQDSMVEHNYFDTNWSSAKYHGEQISGGASEQNVTYRYNIFRDSEVYVFGIHSDNNRGYKIYGNVMIGGNVHGVISSADSATTDVWYDAEIHHNTFINLDLTQGIVFNGAVTEPNQNTILVYNNLAYNCNNPKMQVCVHDYNAFFDCTGTIYAEANRYDATGDPFVSIASGQFEITAATAAGKSDLEETFTVDPKGNLRGVDGVWDIGAYEFIVPKAPTNLRIIE